jgi:hypothetical protein
MGFFSKPLATKAADDVAAASSDPMALLDGIIRELEETREAALRALALSSPIERATLEAAIRELESKLALALEKRDEVRARMARTARIRVLVAEMAALRDESLALSGDAHDEARATEVKNRIEEIRKEAESLKLKSG